MLSLLPLEARSFLEIGCAHGTFGQAIRRVRSGVRLVGIEPVDSQADAAEEHYDKIFRGVYPEILQGNEEMFDCLILNDVLEHMLDPWSSLSGMRALLRPRGVIVASIPSIQYFPVWLKVLRGRWDYADSGTLDRTHLRFFTKATMVEMFETAGYEVQLVRGINSFCDLNPRFRMLRGLEVALGNLRWLQFALVARPQERSSMFAGSPDITTGG